jgi:CheY-like chemotaxis protein
MLSPKQAAEGTGLEAATRLLVVDDNEDAAELLSMMLTKAGYSVRTAFDGPSALLIATDFGPQIALLDIGLPVMDGYELGRRLRGMPRVPRLIAVTGYGQASDQARSREAGFEAHMVKPIDFEKLHRILETLHSSTPAG